MRARQQLEHLQLQRRNANNRILAEKDNILRRDFDPLISEVRKALIRLDECFAILFPGLPSLSADKDILTDDNNVCIEGPRTQVCKGVNELEGDVFADVEWSANEDHSGEGDSDAGEADERITLGVPYALVTLTQSLLLFVQR